MKRLEEKILNKFIDELDTLTCDNCPCHFKKPKGQHTNGNCSCLMNFPSGIKLKILELYKEVKKWKK